MMFLIYWWFWLWLIIGPAGFPGGLPEGKPSASVEKAEGMVRGK